MQSTCERKTSRSARINRRNHCQITVFSLSPAQIAEFARLYGCVTQVAKARRRGAVAAAADAQRRRRGTKPTERLHNGQARRRGAVAAAADAQRRRRGTKPTERLHMVRQGGEEPSQPKRMHSGGGEGRSRRSAYKSDYLLSAFGAAVDVAFSVAWLRSMLYWLNCFSMSSNSPLG